MIHRVCKKCGAQLPLTSEFFHVCNSGKNYRHTCKSCFSDYRKDYYIKNKERELQTNKNRFEVNKEKYYVYMYRWAKENRDRFREYRKNNIEHYRLKERIKSAKRRAILYGLTDHHTTEDIFSLYEEQQARCYYCGCDISGGYHIEHKIPLSRGGSDTKENLCLSCSDCNLAKLTKTEKEFKERLCQSTS